MQARPSRLLPGEWSFWADAMVGGAPFGPVDVSAFTCSSKLSDFGAGSVTLNIPSGLPPGRESLLWSWRLWAYYEGSPIWCGVPTGCTDTGTSAVAFTLTELPGYLARRQFDVNPSKVYTQVEQTVIAADIAQPLADVGVQVVTVPGSGFLRDRTYEYLQSGHRAQLLTELSQVIQGPEFRAEYAETATGSPVCTLRIAFPRVGSGAAGLGVQVPGSALVYSAAWDSDQLRTRTFAVGDMPATASPGTARPIAINDAPQAILPRLDAVDNWPGTVLTTTLKERAATAASQYAAPVLKLSVTPSEALPDITGYRVGDDVTVRAVTPLRPAGVVVTGRLAEIDIDAGAGTAAWVVTSTLPSPKSRETIAVRLRRLDATLANVIHAGPKTVLP
jgi:hypothetical protein